MKFTEMCFNFNGAINFSKREISHMNFLKLNYNEETSREDILEMFQITETDQEILQIDNVQIVALYLNCRDTSILIGFGKFYPNKWISPIAVTSSLGELKEMADNYYCC